MTRLRETFRLILLPPNFLGLLLLNLVLGLSNAFTVPFMSLWGQSLGMSSRTYGTFMTIAELSGVFLAIWLARLSDSRVSRRSVLVLGTSGGIIGYAGYAVVTNVVLLTFIGSIALGLLAACFTQLFAHVREEIDRSEESRPHAPLLLSVQRVFFSLAWTIGPGLGGVLMELDPDQSSYRFVFYGAAILCAVLLVGVLLFVPARPHSAAARDAARVPLRRVLLRGDVAFCVVGLVLFFAAYTAAYLQTLPLMVTEQMGGGRDDWSVIAGICPAIELPLMIWFGRLASRGHTLNLIRLGVALSTLYFILLTFATAPWHVWPMQILIAAAMAINTSITIAYFQDLLPNQAGIATSLFGVSFTVGRLLGMMTFGQLRDVIGNTRLCYVCAAISLVALLAFLVRVRRPTATDATAVDGASPQRT